MIKALKYFLRKPIQFPIALIARLPFFYFINGTKNYQNPICFEMWFKQKVMRLGGNKNVYWPVHETSQVFNAERIYAGVDTCPGIMKGCYIQGRGGIFIGDYTQIAPNVVIISSNHDIYDLREHIDDAVYIGKYCWLGAGAKIMPGVTLGDYTIVGAGSVVTKSFEKGYVVIGGVPAIELKKLNGELCVQFDIKNKFYGFLSEEKFKNLNIKWQ